ncbi:hypothetical protein [Mycobacterium sp. IDR2000157661]|uniref:hypothetical protein n=1 Tax=Mycobacterium sp. IDR2000157661 TaxID=2867005 RepID=UPI001EEB3942|nr:hypothetical protein [Mycobacterium sp. IDR2000157661]ULE33822.1 hypothetical protein K3G64_03775 [Mycobacterium sp. IDR2000157661]
MTRGREAVTEAYGCTADSIEVTVEKVADELFAGVKGVGHASPPDLPAPGADRYLPRDVSAVLPRYISDHNYYCKPGFITANVPEGVSLMDILVMKAGKPAGDGVGVPTVRRVEAGNSHETCSAATGTTMPRNPWC